MVRIYESQLPFGFCLTFDGVGGFYTMPSLRWVSIAFRLLPHFRPVPRPREDHDRPVQSQLPFGFCLTFDLAVGGYVLYNK